MGENEYILRGKGGERGGKGRGRWEGGEEGGRREWDGGERGGVGGDGGR
jgi:hypothetical protein